MSGTTLRKVLGEKKPRVQKEKIFKDIFGWYDKNTANMIFDKLESLQETKKSAIAEIMKKKNQIIEIEIEIEKQNFFIFILDLDKSKAKKIKIIFSLNISLTKSCFFFFFKKKY
jgi:hypothetical protein